MGWFGSREDMIAVARGKATRTAADRLEAMASEYRQLMLDMVPGGDGTYFPPETHPSFGLGTPMVRCMVLAGGVFRSEDGTAMSAAELLGAAEGIPLGLPGIEADMRRNLSIAADVAVAREASDARE